LLTCLAYCADHSTQVKELVIPHYNTLLNIYFFGTTRIAQAHMDMGGSTVVTSSVSIEMDEPILQGIALAVLLIAAVTQGRGAKKRCLPA